MPRRGGGGWLGDTEQRAFGGKTTTKFPVNSSKRIQVPSGRWLREEEEDEFVLVCSTDLVFGCASWQGAAVKGRRVSQPGSSSSLPRFKVSEQLLLPGKAGPGHPRALPRGEKKIHLGKKENQPQPPHRGLSSGSLRQKAAEPGHERVLSVAAQIPLPGRVAGGNIFPVQLDKFLGRLFFSLGATCVVWLPTFFAAQVFHQRIFYFGTWSGPKPAPHPPAPFYILNILIILPRTT